MASRNEKKKTPEEEVVWHTRLIQLALLATALLIATTIFDALNEQRANWVRPGAIVEWYCLAALAVVMAAMAAISWRQLRLLGYAIVQATITLLDQNYSAYFIRAADGPETKGKECKSGQFLPIVSWLPLLLGPNFERKTIPANFSFDMDILGCLRRVHVHFHPGRVGEIYQRADICAEAKRYLELFIAFVSAGFARRYGPREVSQADHVNRALSEYIRFADIRDNSGHRPFSISSIELVENYPILPPRSRIPHG